MDEVVQEHLDEHARSYSIDLEEKVSELEDGDVLFLWLPPEREGRHLLGETAYVSPAGIRSDGFGMRRRFEHFVAIELAALSSGMAFDVTELDDYVCALEYDVTATTAARADPVLVEVHSSFEEVAASNDGIDTRSDLVEPFHVSLDSYDDGLYEGTLYDSGGGDGAEPSAHRELCSASAYPDYEVPMDWPRDRDYRMVPVEELHLGENEYSDRPVAVLDRDADPVRP